MPTGIPFWQRLQLPVKYRAIIGTADIPAHMARQFWQGQEKGMVPGSGADH